MYDGKYDSMSGSAGSGGVTASGGFMHDLMFDFKTSAAVLLFVAWLSY